VRLTNANTYAGATTVSAGILRVENASALGAANGTSVKNGGTLHISDVQILNESISIAGGTLKGSGPNAALSAAVTLLPSDPVGGTFRPSPAALLYK